MSRRILLHEVSKLTCFRVVRTVEEMLPFELISIQDHNFLAALCVHGRPCHSSHSSEIQSHPIDMDMGMESSL
jgi:hypothetical protein